jgi:hypothetical protein
MSSTQDSYSSFNMPVLLHKSLKAHDKLKPVVDALEDVKLILKCNNETFNRQTGGNGDTLWSDLHGILLKYFGYDYMTKNYLLRYTSKIRRL